MSCKYCNFRNTSQCVLEKLNERFENEEISEDELKSESEIAYMKCQDEYYDYQIDEGENR